MTCPSLPTTDLTTLWYSEDPDVGADIPDTFTWKNLLITGEQVEPKLTSTVLDDITPERSYSGSKLSGGEVSGSFSFYARANDQLYNLLIASLQSSQALSMTSEVTGASGVIINSPGATSAAARTLVLTGLSAIEGATYSVVIDGVDFKYVAEATPTLASVAAGLAAVVDASTNYAAAAAVSGASGVAVSAAGSVPGDSRTVTLTGLSLVVGAAYKITIGATVFSHTVLASDTLATVATALAALIDADAAFTSTAAGAVVTVDTGAGTSTLTFSTSTVVTISSGAGRQTVGFASWVPEAWAPGERLQNGSSTKCLTFLKRVQITDSTYDWYVFRGVQISSLAFDIKPKSPITCSCNVFGVRPDAPVTASALPVGWTFVDADVTEAMSGSDGLDNFEIQAASGLDSNLVVQDLTITIDNQMRAQDAVGLGHIFSAGVASGKIKVTLSGTVYYASPRIYEDLLADRTLRIVGDLVDPNGDGFSFVVDKAKVTAGGILLADSAGKDATVKTDFQAFESDTYGTISVTRLAG